MRTLLAFAIATALCSAARAEDWSQFIDKNPSQPIAVAPATHTPEAKPAASARPTKSVATKAKAKPRASAKTSKSRHK